MTEELQLPVGRVPDGWKVLSLKDVTSKIGSGSTPRGGASVYVEVGASFIRSQNVLDHGFSSDGLVRINKEAAYSLRGVEVRKGDVLINITGDSILRTCIVPDEVLPAHVSQHVAILRSNGLIEPQVLQKWLSLEVMKDFMLGHSSGGTRKAVTKGDLERFPVPVPPLAEQREIASVLGALDDKIESNHRMGDLLIQLARTMLDTGEIEVRLGDIATCDKGLSYKGDGLEEDLSVGLPMVNLANFGVDGWLNPEKMKYYSGEYKERHLLRAGDLVVANTDLTQQRVIIGRPALVPPSLGKAIFTHHVTAIRPLKDEKLRLPIWAQLNSSAFRERAEGFATGTTVAGMPVETLLDFHVRIPDVGIICAAQELLERVWAAESESRFLKHAREILMPELLSGRLRVKDAESMMENV